MPRAALCPGKIAPARRFSPVRTVSSEGPNCAAAGHIPPDGLVRVSQTDLPVKIRPPAVSRTPPGRSLQDFGRRSTRLRQPFRDGLPGRRQAPRGQCDPVHTRRARAELMLRNRRLNGYLNGAWRSQMAFIAYMLPRARRRNDQNHCHIFRRRPYCVSAAGIPGPGLESRAYLSTPRNFP